MRPPRKEDPETEDGRKHAVSPDEHLLILY